MFQITHCFFLDPGDSRWVGMWWGGFLLCGLLLVIVAIPFFSFPKVLTHEKEKIRLMEKAAAATGAGTSTGTSNSANKNANPATKNDTGYGKDVKGNRYSYI